MRRKIEKHELLRERKRPKRIKGKKNRLSRCRKAASSTLERSHPGGSRSIKKESVLEKSAV